LDKRGNTVNIGNTVLGGGDVKICIPLSGETWDVLSERIQAVKSASPDIIEWRIDSLAGSIQKADAAGILRKIRNEAGDIPVLCTLRTAAEGGDCSIDGDAYRAFYKELCEAGTPDAIDVEICSKPCAAAEIIAEAHGRNIPVIGSCHNFQATPQASVILKTLKTMAAAGADIVKMAVYPHSEADVDAVFDAAAQYRSMEDHRPFILISMGEAGKRTRIEALQAGTAMCFATAGGVSSAPGQIPADELRRIWNEKNGNAGDL